MLTPDIENTMLDALSKAGLLVERIEPDGKLHRTPTADKPKGKDGAYIAHSDAPVSIWWQNFRVGESGTWTAKEKGKLSTAEREALKRRMGESRKTREAEQVRSHAEAAEKAQAIYDACADLTAHLYLCNKGVKAASGLKLHKSGALVVPMHEESGKLVSLQFIDNDGTKRFLKGGRKRGCYFFIGGKEADKTLLICEGLATGLSLHESTRLPVLVAFDAGNLEHVARLARNKHPMREIVLCADNDTETPGNPGVAKASDAAKAVNGFLAVPHNDGRKVDWNDMHQLKGSWEVLEQLMKRMKPGQPDSSRATTTPTQSEQTAQPRLHCVTAHDFLNMNFPPREMLLSPILPRQGLCMLHAMRGIGKTFVSLSVAYAVASGGKVFGRWAALQPARVLFIDGEMPAITLQERLASLIAGSDLEPPRSDHLRILTPDMQGGPMPNLATLEGQEAVEAFLEGVDLVVVDNLATLARHGRSNDEESWIPVQGWLLGLRKRGISVLMVHHQGKGGDQRGTSAKEDILDTVIRLDRPKDYHAEQGARFEVHLTKARGICGDDAKSFEAQLLADGQRLIWTSRDIEDVELEQVRQFLAEGYSQRDIAKELDISLGKVQRLKKKLDASKPRISSSTVNSFTMGES